MADIIKTLTKEEIAERDLQSLNDTVGALQKKLAKDRKELKEHKAALEIQSRKIMELSHERDNLFEEVLFQKSIIRKLVK